MKNTLSFIALSLMFLGNSSVLLAGENDSFQQSALVQQPEFQKSDSKEVFVPYDHCQALKESLKRNRFEQLYYHPRIEDFEKCMEQQSADTLSNRRLYLERLANEIGHEKTEILALAKTIQEIRTQLSAVHNKKLRTDLTDEEQLALFEQEADLKKQETSALRSIHCHSNNFQIKWQEKDAYIEALNETRENLNHHDQEKNTRSAEERNQITTLVRELLYLKNNQ